MAKKHFTGAAPLAAKVVTIAVSNAAAGTTYKLTVGDKTITGAGNASAATVVSNLVTAWGANSDNHPHTSRITASATGASIKLTADVAGVPFDVAPSVTGGSGTFGSVVTVTANSGPSDVSKAANWSDGAAPGNNDEIYFRDLSQNVIYGLDGLTATALKVHIDQTFTGKIGLNPNVFAIDVNGDSVTGAPEYRADYLTVNAAQIQIGAHDGPGSPNGSQRVKVKNSATGASETTIHNSAAQASETGKAAIRLILDSATADVYVRKAPGGVGIAADTAGEVSEVGDVFVSDTTNLTRVMLGEGVTLDTFTQDGGDNVIRAAADITKVTVHGGTLRTEGDYQITTLEQNGGTVYPNHDHTATGAAVITYNLNGGTADYTASLEARDIGTLNHKGGSLTADPDTLAIGTYNEPTEKFTITVQ